MTQPLQVVIPEAPLQVIQSAGLPELTFDSRYKSTSSSVQYWNRYVQDDVGEVRVKILTDGFLAPGEMTATYTLGGTAVEDINYTVLNPSPVTLSANQTEYELVFNIINPGQFYAERELTLTLTSGTNARLGDAAKTVYRLFIRSTTAAPTIQFDGASQTASVGTPPTSFTAQVNLSEPCLDDVTAYVRVNAGTSDAATGDYTITEAVIPAGSYSADMTMEWTGAAPSPNETLVVDIENDTRGIVNLWSFSDELVEPEGPDFGETPETKPHATYPTDHLYKDNNSTQVSWSAIYPIPLEGTTPDGRANAGRFALSQGATGTCKIGKTFTGWVTGTDDIGVDGSDQLYGVSDDNPNGFMVDGEAMTFSVYVKQPAATEHQHDSLTLALLDRIGNLSDGLQLAHTGGFSASGSTLVRSAALTENLDYPAGGGPNEDDNWGILTGQAWDDGDDTGSNGWHRIYLTYTPTATTNTYKGLTENGDEGHPTNRFINYWIGGSDDAPLERGQGWLLAWPQLEKSATATAYQRNGNQWGEPWGNARALTGGTLTHTFTVTT